MRKNIKDIALFYELEWDTMFFGIRCAKAILAQPLTLAAWKELKTLFQQYQFISVENCNSEPINAQFIGQETSAFLADVNIQFAKNLNANIKNNENITIQKALKRNDQLLEIANFPYSKFTEDPELLKRGGNCVYQQWLLNSFGETGKSFAISKGKDGKIDGFLLHSYVCSVCTIELIAVSNKSMGRGIGTKLFEAVEFSAIQNKCKEIRVGTQVRNMEAINFYHKVGCKQIGCHQIYHLWCL